MRTSLDFYTSKTIFRSLSAESERHLMVRRGGPDRVDADVAWVRVRPRVNDREEQPNSMRWVALSHYSARNF